MFLQARVVTTDVFVNPGNYDLCTHCSERE